MTTCCESSLLIIQMSFQRYLGFLKSEWLQNYSYLALLLTYMYVYSYVSIWFSLVYRFFV